MREEQSVDVVTGAYGFTGQYITRRLLAMGRRVRTLTGHPERAHSFAQSVPAAPFRFDDPAALVQSLAGAKTLYNTYWIRFEKGEMTFARAVKNTGILLAAAREAGLSRVVHLSAVNARVDSPYPYFRAKGEAEKMVCESGLAYSILRPTVLFGPESLLFNNIAWMLRKFPLFAIPGTGRYRLQPLYVDDVAAVAVQEGQSERVQIRDVAGPEIFPFEELVRLIAKVIGSRARIVHVKPERFMHYSRLIAGMVKDVLLTREEIEALVGEVLISEESLDGTTTRFSEWLPRHASSLGVSYRSELELHYHG